MNSHLQVLNQWAQQQLNDPDVTLQPLYGDASRRRYYRVRKSSNSLIIVDAAAERHEVQAFVAIGEALRQRGLQVPTIYAIDVEQGFLLLSDFGDKVLLRQLTADNVASYYQQALDNLLCIQSNHEIKHYTVLDYDTALITHEWNVFTEWFLQKYHKVPLGAQQTLLNNVLQLLIEVMQQQPQVFIHRDYHSGNLMVLADQQLGILDFQGARRGPITYDLVSLLKDCYIAWPRQQVQQWALAMQTRIWQQANCAVVSEAQFLRYFDLTGLQRHLKALGQFARKAIAEHDQRYLNHIPRVKQYVLDVCTRYNELTLFKQFLLEIDF